MDLDLKGRISNTRLPLSNGLCPLFEAISNSIHAIDEAKETKATLDFLDGRRGLKESRESWV